jgi:hypothetical protein
MKVRYTTRASVPEGFTGKQAVLIVDKYMKEHPEMLHFNAGPIVFLALWGAFPCSKLSLEALQNASVGNLPDGLGR